VAAAPSARGLVRLNHSEKVALGVLIDYALYTVSDWWAMPCRCGAGRCRGVVTGNDWRLPEVQARYRGHFVPEVARRIGSRTPPSGKMGT
jgi:hypothetical protein